MELFPREQRGKAAIPYFPTPSTRRKRWPLRSSQMEQVMTTQSSNTPTQSQLRDSELNAVIGGHQKFPHETINGHTYAVGHVNGSTVMVKVS